MKRKKYTREFKKQAVKLVLEEGFSVKTVSKELEIHYNSLYKWIVEYEENGELAFPGNGSRDYIYQNKIKQLEKENERLQEELEILKKFQIFLKKNNK
jgi:transposase-like protein